MIKSKENKEVLFTIKDISKLSNKSLYAVRTGLSRKNILPIKIEKRIRKNGCSIVNLYSLNQVRLYLKIPNLYPIIKKPKKQYFEFSETVITKKSSLWN